MKFFDYRVSKTIKEWLGWILRPRLAYLRIREARHARNAPPVRNNLSLSALPFVDIRPAKTPEDLAHVVDLYRRNPSNMAISPQNNAAMERMIARNIEFYRIFDDKGKCVGNIAFQVDRCMLSYLTIEYARRGSGVGLAAINAMSKLLGQRGIDTLYGQVYRNNRRSLAIFLSLGFEIVEEQSTEEYFFLRKVLISPNP